MLKVKVQNSNRTTKLKDKYVDTLLKNIGVLRFPFGHLPFIVPWAPIALSLRHNYKIAPLSLSIYPLF